MEKSDVDPGGRLPLSLSTIFFETGSFAESRAHQVSKSSWPASPRDPPSLVLGLEVSATVPTLFIVLGIQTQIFMLALT